MNEERERFEMDKEEFWELVNRMNQYLITYSNGIIKEEFCGDISQGLANVAKTYFSEDMRLYR